MPVEGEEVEDQENNEEAEVEEDNTGQEPEEAGIEARWRREGLSHGPWERKATPLLPYPRAQAEAQAKIKAAAMAKPEQHRVTGQDVVVSFGIDQGDEPDNPSPGWSSLQPSANINVHHRRWQPQDHSRIRRGITYGDVVSDDENSPTKKGHGGRQNLSRMQHAGPHPITFLVSIAPPLWYTLQDNLRQVPALTPLPVLACLAWIFSLLHRLVSILSPLLRAGRNRLSNTRMLLPMDKAAIGQIIYLGALIYLMLGFYSARQDWLGANGLDRGVGLVRSRRATYYGGGWEFGPWMALKDFMLELA